MNISTMLLRQKFHFNIQNVYDQSKNCVRLRKSCAKLCCLNWIGRQFFLWTNIRNFELFWYSIWLRINLKSSEVKKGIYVLRRARYSSSSVNHNTLRGTIASVQEHAYNQRALLSDIRLSLPLPLPLLQLANQQPHHGDGTSPPLSAKKITPMKLRCRIQTNRQQKHKINPWTWLLFCYSVAMIP